MRVGVNVLGWNKYLDHHGDTGARAGGSLCKVVNLVQQREVFVSIGQVVIVVSCQLVLVMFHAVQR